MFSSGMLRSVEWQFLTDVSGQPVCLFFKGQEFQFGKERIITPHCVISQKGPDCTQDLFSGQKTGGILPKLQKYMEICML